MPVKKMIGTFGALLASALYLGHAPAFAGEGVRPAGPIGGTDINQALLPPPGLYGAVVDVTTALTGFFNHDASITTSSGLDLVGGAGLLYVYDTTLFGGALASSVFLGADRLCFKVNNVFDRCSVGQQDIYSDVLMWSRFFPIVDASAQPSGLPPIPYGLAVMAGMSVVAPTGVYDRENNINVGSNVWDIAPNLALTYTVPSIFGPTFGQATQFSVRAWLNNYTENPATKYQSGTVLSIDFAMSQVYNDYQFGIAGTTFFQLNADEINGLEVGNYGNRARLFSLGPIVSRKFVFIDRPYEFAIKGLISTWGTNTIRADALIVRLSTKLF
ncbi:transporter [Xanthobacter sp. AM11]|uniref:SphA family protein n=1 Tax=Xanthobacter sp. AM11 TaxID=3380643 RepID=UPI0039BF09BA